MGCDWQAGASQPSRFNGTIFLYIHICVCVSRTVHTVCASNFARMLNSKALPGVPQQRIQRHCLQQSTPEERLFRRRATEMMDRAPTKQRFASEAAEERGAQ